MSNKEVRVVAKDMLKEGSSAAFFADAKELVEKTRLEDGCLFYDIWTSSENPNEIAFLEGWESQAALDAHMETEHFVRIVAKLNDYRAKPTDIAIYTKPE